jgi:hypothetical protein
MKEKTPPAGPKEPPTKDKKSKVNPKGKSKEPEVELPVMVEMAFRLPILLILAVDGIMVVLSYTSGASWEDIFIRVVVTTILMGGVLLLISWNLSSSALAAALSKQELAAQPAEREPSALGHESQTAGVEMEKEA